MTARLQKVGTMLAFAATACLARDFGECVNGAKREGDECVLPDAPPDPGDGDTDADSGPRLDGGGMNDAGDGPNDSGPSGIDSSTPDASPSCERSPQCAATTPVCHDGSCIGCSNDMDCARLSTVALPACAKGGACVECTTNNHCLNPKKPVCGASDTCEGPCTSDLDCEHTSTAWSTPHCELGEGKCVACIPGALEVEQCENGNACDPVTMTCTGKPRKSVQNCFPCSTDTECATGLNCVATTSPQAPHEKYCVLRKDTGACPNQFSAKRMATSVLGVSAPYCFPDEQLTTCEAVRAFSTVCSGPGTCPPGGLCEGTIGDKRCTYECDGPSDCSKSCVSVAPAYCSQN
jgi:hypothetical protein